MSDSVSKYYENETTNEIKQYEFEVESPTSIDYMNLLVENKELKERIKELEIASFQDLGR